MLAADKLQLQSAFRQRATALKEKEFNLHASNYSKFQQVVSFVIFVRLLACLLACTVLVLI
jgi:hypothetical protein